ncbi:hypothetical protein ACB092_05G031200 [Castanea dentata]
MGFRDIRSFNLAMLAKQGWRMLTDQGFLLYRCFKAKYFPHCTFLEAVDHPHSSYVWKSLLAAQPILKKGCCWRMVMGSSIRVLSDKWLPCHPTNKILVPPNEVEEDWHVSELINWTTFQWNHDLIDSIFHRFDAEAIYRIPLSRRCVPDVLVWLHNKNGQYLVKSGFHTTRLLLKETNRVGEGSVLMSSSKVWAKIWKLQIPNKIKECGVAQDVWAGCSHRSLQKSTTDQGNVMQLFEHLIQQLSVDAIEIFLVQSWLIWNQRNMVPHGAKLQEPGRLNERANSLLSWQPPEGTLYKLNFEAAVFTDMAASSVGVIIWNYNGQVMAALLSKGPTVLDSEEAEILACLQAMEFAIDAGFSELVVEGDNINVMCSIFSDRTDWSQLGNIYDDICWLAGRLRHMEFQSIRRSANGVADSLARYAKHISEDIITTKNGCIWLEDSPPPALEALYLDSISIAN